MDNFTTFLWMDSHPDSHLLDDAPKRRPTADGWDILAELVGDGNVTQHYSSRLPHKSIFSGKTDEQWAQALKEEVWRFRADYLILEGCRINVILKILEDPKFKDRVLLVKRNKIGQVTGFQVALARLATKPFRPKKSSHV